MTREFIPYKQALELKELGFDEPCFGWFRTALMPSNFTEYFLETELDLNQEFTDLINNNFTGGACSAPLYQQAFRWFREKYKLHQYIKQYCGENFFFHIEDMVHPRRFDEYTVEMLRSFNESTSQEEAELACLIKLIEIVKNK